MIKTHRDRVRLFPGEVGSRERCEPHRLGFLTPSGGERTRPKAAASRGFRTSFRPSCDATLAYMCIAATTAPSRKPREAVSMSLYHRSLVLGAVALALVIGLSSSFGAKAKQFLGGLLHGADCRAASVQLESLLAI